MNVNNLFKYWPVIIFIGGIIIMWAGFGTSIKSNTERIVSLEARASASDSSNTQVLVQLSQIQADLSWIKNKLK